MYTKSLIKHPDGTVECPYCHSSWKSRKTQPKSCPFCHRYFTQVDFRKEITKILMAPDVKSRGITVFDYMQKILELNLLPAEAAAYMRDILDVWSSI